MPGPEPFLVVRGLTKHFPLYQPRLLGLARQQIGTVAAVEDVSFVVQRFCCTGPGRGDLVVQCPRSEVGNEYRGHF